VTKNCHVTEKFMTCQKNCHVTKKVLSRHKKVLSRHKTKVVTTKNYHYRPITEEDTKRAGFGFSSWMVSRFLIHVIGWGKCRDMIRHDVKRQSNYCHVWSYSVEHKPVFSHHSLAISQNCMCLGVSLYCHTCLVLCVCLILAYYPRTTSLDAQTNTKKQRTCSARRRVRLSFQVRWRR
jgi:hypothetical protein